jgi:deoxyribose-phosphate aldolase
MMHLAIRKQGGVHMTDLIKPNRTTIELAKMIDHTVLSPTATTDDFIKGCDIAAAYGTAAFCGPSSEAALISRRLAGTSVKTCAVVGFPHGNAHLAAKIAEAKAAAEDGASEIDMVIRIGDAIAQRWQMVEEEIAAVNEMVTSRGAILKVIFETCFLTDESIVELSRIAVRTGAAFVKTSTGFGPAGATENHVALMRKSVPSTMGVKASGGIRTLADVERFIAAGATRIGTSSTIAILGQ